jgi:signal transduction histidine kinase
LKAGEVGHKKPSQRLPLDFDALVRECIEIARTRHHLPPEAVHYETTMNGTGATVAGDSEELRTAVSNLLDNAIKYSGERVEVRVRVEMPDAKQIALSVQDRGVGIPEVELKRIFRRFYRVQNRTLNKVKGTGLGLFIVRAIARKHGGRVFAASEGEGHGTTVTMELPRSVA